MELTASFGRLAELADALVWSERLAWSTPKSLLLDGNRCHIA